MNRARDVYSARYQFLDDRDLLMQYDMYRRTLDLHVPLQFAHDPPILIPPMYPDDPRRVRVRELLVLLEVLLNEMDQYDECMLDILAGRFFTRPAETEEEQRAIAAYGLKFQRHCETAPQDDIFRLVYLDTFGGRGGTELFRHLFYLDCGFDVDPVE